MHLVQFERGSMDKLEELTVNFSSDQRSLIGIEHLPNLKEVEVFGNKTNSSMMAALDHIMEESNARPEHKRFNVVVR
jgi:disease resistance protein RPM1